MALSFNSIFIRICFSIPNIYNKGIKLGKIRKTYLVVSLIRFGGIEDKVVMVTSVY